MVENGKAEPEIVAEDLIGCLYCGAIPDSPCSPDCRCEDCLEAA